MAPSLIDGSSGEASLLNKAADEGEKPQPKDLSHHLSTVSKKRSPSRMKELYKYYTPGVRNLAGGLPYAGYFPFDTFESSIATPDRFPTGLSTSLPAAPAASRNPFLRFLTTHPLNPNESTSSTTSARLSVPKFFPDPLAEGADIIDIATALQYGSCTGYAALLAWVKEFALKYQFQGKIPYKDPDIILTCGNTDGFSKAIQTIAEGRLIFAEGEEVRFGGRGDSLLVEEYCYMTAVETASPLGIGIVPVKCDEEGMSAMNLKIVLDTWDEKQMGKRPSVMYTVTIGQNPTGGVLSMKRRQEIYHICEDYDIIIVEDDPYWYLQYPEKHPPAAITISDSAIASGEDFVARLVPSYITIDTSGRVLQLSTFSKSIAPGCRLGYVVGQPLFIERLLRLSECSSQQPSGFVQAMVAELVVHVWGFSGWMRWLESLRRQYWIRMSTMCEILEQGRHVTGITNNLRTTHVEPDYTVVSNEAMYDFNWPKGGMFIWVHIHIANHPSFEALLSSMTSTADDDEETTAKAKIKLTETMMTKLWVSIALKNLVLVVPGATFSPTQATLASSSEHFRICIAAVEDEIVSSSTHDFVAGVTEFWDERWETWDELNADL